MMTPQVTQKNLTNLGIIANYDLKRPVAQPVATIVDSVSGIANVLSAPQQYKTFESGIFASTASNLSVVANVYAAGVLVYSFQCTDTVTI